MANDDLPRELDKGLKAAFRGTPESVLQPLARRTGRDLSVHVPDPGSDRAPPVKVPAPGERGLPHSRRYQVLGEIARGGIGVVYKGRDVDLGRDVALKVLRGDTGADDTALARFVEEAQIGGQLQHPGIVPVYELGVQDDLRPFFAMKLIQGETLGALLQRRRPEDRRRLLGVFEQVCQTMAYAHARRVVHRDLKPSNILVGSYGEVQVVDWGCAKVLPKGGIADERRAPPAKEPRTVIRTVRTDREGSESQQGSVMGTPAYMPPEQALGEVDVLDTRSDVFSLGAMLCEILTGEPPYAAGDRRETALARAARADLDHALARLDACGADPDLVRLARACLAPGPDDRPRDAGELAEALSAHLLAVEERARAAELAATEAKVKAEGERRRRKLTLALAAALLAAVLGGAGGLFALRQRAEERRADAQAELRHADTLRARAEAAPDDRRVLLLAEAVGAGERAAAKAPGPEVERHVAALRDAHAAAVAERDRNERDRGMRAALQALRIPGDQDMRHYDRTRENARLAGAYEAAFAFYGAGAPEDAAPAMRLPLAAALDRWALALRKGGAWREKLDRARALDPDAWRNRLRDALEAPALDAEALGALVDAPDLEQQPPETMVLLASMLEAAGRDPLPLLERGIRAHPQDFTLRVHAGVLCEGTERPLRAERFYDQAYALRPDMPEVLHRRGVSLENAERWDEAVTVFAELVRLDPDDGHWHQHLGDIALRRDRFEEAVAHLGRAAGLGIDDHRLHAGLGKALMRLGRPDTALQHLDRALALAHGGGAMEAAVRTDRMLVLAQSGRGGEARQEAGRALALWQDVARREPRHPRAWHLAGAILWMQDELDAAVEACRRQLDVNPGHAETWLFLGRALLSRGDHACAAEALATSARLDPEGPEVFALLGDALHRSGDLAGAAGAFRTALDKNPSHGVAAARLAVCLRDSGDDAGALEAFRRAAALLPENPNVRADLGHSAFESGLYVDACEALERALLLEARGRGALDLPAAELLEEAKRMREAEPRLRAIVEGRDEPPSPDEALDAARHAARTGAHERAAALYAHAFADGPRTPSARDRMRAARCCVLAAPGLPRLRREALEHVQPLLAPAAARTEHLRRLSRDRAFDTVRAPAALETLPPAEAKAWYGFWVDVRAALAQG